MNWFPFCAPAWSCFLWPHPIVIKNTRNAILWFTPANCSMVGVVGAFPGAMRHLAMLGVPSSLTPSSPGGRGGGNQPSHSTAPMPSPALKVLGPPALPPLSLALRQVVGHKTQAGSGAVKVPSHPFHQPNPFREVFSFSDDFCAEVKCAGPIGQSDQISGSQISGTP